MPGIDQFGGASPMMSSNSFQGDAGWQAQGFVTASPMMPGKGFKGDASWETPAYVKDQFGGASPIMPGTDQFGGASPSMPGKGSKEAVDSSHPQLDHYKIDEFGGASPVVPGRSSKGPPKGKSKGK